MGEVEGFLKYRRMDPKKQAVDLRLKHFDEFMEPLNDRDLRKQGARCMDCGVPFCHQGCPLGNNIPEWNDLVSKSDWKKALHSLHQTNNFPEFTGRVCPAPCETACVLGINEDPISIEAIEMAIADKGFEYGWIEPLVPEARTGFTIAIVGSGPAGLAAAQQLNRKGHLVTVYERSDRPGGLLMYGIPDFKLAKDKVLRRVDQLKAEGITFVLNTEIGVDVTMAELEADFDRVLVASGASKPRDIAIPGRSLTGIHFADDILRMATKYKFNDSDSNNRVTARGKHVIVIGGGDTGSDCLGTSLRQGAKSVTQFEIMPMPVDLGRFPRAPERPEVSPWPAWTMMLRTSTSQQEGGKREWAVLTKKFIGDENGTIKAMETVDVEWQEDESGKKHMVPMEGSERTWPCDLALIAVGFEGIDKDFSLAITDRGQIQTKENAFETSSKKVFAAGDARRGQSLVVWAIAEGRQAAEAIHSSLQV